MRRFSISQSKRCIPESLFAVNFRAAPCALGSLETRFIIPLQGLSEVHGRTLGIDLARIRNWTRKMTHSRQVGHEFRGNRPLGISKCLGDISSTCILKEDRDSMTVVLRSFDEQDGRVEDGKEHYRGTSGLLWCMYRCSNVHCLLPTRP